MRRSDAVLTVAVGAYYAAEYGAWYVVHALLFVVFGSFSVMGFMLSKDGAAMGIMFAGIALIFGGAAYCVRHKRLQEREAEQHEAERLYRAEQQREYELAYYRNQTFIPVGNFHCRQEPRFTR